MRTKTLPADDPSAVRHAADVLRNGGLVAFPTDTVYGLATLPFHHEMVERLYVVKGRSHTKAVAVLLSRASELKKVATRPGKIARRLAEVFWPGPLTLVVPKHPRLPDILSQAPTVGVRVPDHPLALALLRETGPLAVTSANVSGGPNTQSAQEVSTQLNGRVHLILDGGRSPGGIPSTVVDCTTDKPVILRPGPISEEELLAALDPTYS